MSVKPNTLFTGDNLYIMHGMNSESADLIYLDPPFNTKRFYAAPIGSKAAGAQFKDMWSWDDVDKACLERLAKDYPGLWHLGSAIQEIHSVAMAAYVTYMAQRIIEMQRILKPTGSIYLHCDPTASHYLKGVMDAIFGQQNFCNEIIWHYEKWTNAVHSFQRNHDVVLMYSLTNRHTFNKLYGKQTERQKELRRAGYNTGSSAGRRIVRVYDRNNPKVQARLARWAKEGRAIYDVDPPRAKALSDVWAISALNGQAKERVGYPTQKPLALLERIIRASSNEGDVVFDPFCGCATTMVAAQRLGRKWIGIDVEEKSADLVIERLSDDARMFKDFIHRRDIPERTDKPIVDIKKAKVKALLYGRQVGKCVGCHTHMEIQHFDIDHIIPRSKGGTDSMDNLQLLCGNCNSVKGDRPMDYLRSIINQREQQKLQLSFGL